MLLHQTTEFYSEHPQFDARRVMRELALDPTTTTVRVESTSPFEKYARVTLTYLDEIKFPEPVAGND